MLYRPCMTEEELLSEAASRIHAAAPEAEIVAFGSRARGEALQSSDLDLLIIEPEVKHTALESIRLRRTLAGLPVAVDVVVVSRSEADEWRGVAGSLVHAALSDGFTLSSDG